MSGREMTGDPMEIDSWEGGPVNYFRTGLQVSPPVHVLDDSAGMENRAFYSELAIYHGEATTSAAMNQVEVQEAERIEKCIIFEINRIRSEFRVALINVSDLLRQAGKSQSQFFCGNCLRRENNMPFQFVSYSVRRMPEQQPAPFARMLAKYWRDTKAMIHELTAHSLKEIGVGVWGSSESFIITIVKYE